MLVTENVATKLHEEAHTLSVAEVADYLQGRLGQRMAAYLAGLSDAKQVGRYIKGTHKPTRAVEQRLREGYKVVRMLETAYDADTAKVWLFGTNTRLDDEAPIGLLRRAAGPEDFTPVVRAARQFAAVA
jgi:hypothetical protein